MFEVDNGTWVMKWSDQVSPFYVGACFRHVIRRCSMCTGLGRLACELKRGLLDVFLPHKTLKKGEALLQSKTRDPYAMENV